MNERIKEILFEAGGKYGGYNHLTGNDNIYTEDVDYEKFAELIVRECAKLQHKNVIVGGVSEYNKGRRTLAEDILKHFGVDE